ncbi:hypothetical protein B0G84_4340 [Paraburkholderia sp. BL8N3]|jgi:predicted Fe-S protein YdhL (DUF1289 family)|nr:DUF1289 domain-containing protein [Paraburkholderia sp. BL8N3]TCK39012.1 hypothetical protein B0G84_4340 [Paraburkholderia sp. BL8N3]
MTTTNTEATPLELAFTIERAKSQEPVGSPCTNVCRLDQATGFCEGCFRNREEIRAWKTMDDARKIALFDVLAQRMAERGA